MWATPKAAHRYMYILHCCVALYTTTHYIVTYIVWVRRVMYCNNY